MRNRKRYGKDWKKRAQACKERTGWHCIECGVKHGTLKVSVWTGEQWPVWLQAAHINHDPENEYAELACVSPKCHWRFYRRPGQPAAWVIERMKHRRLIVLAYLS